MIEFVHVSKTYQVGTEVRALQDVSFRIGSTELLGIVGPSGSGKSTMLHLLGLLDRPTSGAILFQGRDTATLDDHELSRLRGQTIGFVFQSFHLIPHLSVVENVQLPLFYQGVGPRARRERALAQLQAVGLTARAHHLPAQLSGGERQRTAIARALVTEPALLLADEPTGNLDSRTGAEILALFHQLHERGRALVMITHDRSIAARLPRVLELADGAIVREGRPA